MMNRAYVRRGALGGVAIGLMAAALTAGCGGDGSVGAKTTAANEPTATDQQKAVITPLGFTTTGCGFTASFGITSPSAINFVAFNQATNNNTFANLQSQLYNVDDQGVQTQVNQTAQQASSAMQAMLNAYT